MTPAKEQAAVSVIIPCFRCAKTIERAIASVAAQTVLPAEVILVDDASGDGTRLLLSELKSHYATGWVKLVLLDQNVGAGSARNAGWAAASQPLIAFLDADDAWHFRKIEIQHAYMAANPDVALCGHGFRLLKQGVLPYWQMAHDAVESLCDAVGHDPARCRAPVCRSPALHGRPHALAACGVRRCQGGQAA